jgi:arginase
MDMMRKPLAMLDAPSNLGLRPPREGREPGVRRMAAALRATGLLARLGAEDAGEVPPPGYSPALDPVVRIRNASAIRDYSRALAGRLGVLLDSERFPLVLGGDCSIFSGPCWLCGNAVDMASSTSTATRTSPPQRPRPAVGGH